MLYQHTGLQLAMLLAATLLLCACSNVGRAQAIVAHRGASATAPENTLAAFRLAWDEGADAIEGDFYLSRDGQIVTIHDDNTERTGGVKQRVVDCTLAELQQLDVGSWKSPVYQGERIPTLPEVLAIVPADKKILIEIKCGPEIVPQLKRALADSQLAPEQTIVISFQESVISAVKNQIPAIKAYWLTGYKQDKATGRWTPALPDVLATLKRLGADGLDTQANRDVVNEQFVQAIRDAGFELHVWTIDEADDARHFRQLGVDSITTNRPQWIRQQLAKPTKATQQP